MGEVNITVQSSSHLWSAFSMSIVSRILKYQKLDWSAFVFFANDQNFFFWSSTYSWNV